MECLSCARFDFCSWRSRSNCCCCCFWALFDDFVDEGSKIRRNASRQLHLRHRRFVDDALEEEAPPFAARDFDLRRQHTFDSNSGSEKKYKKQLKYVVFLIRI